ncbi:hypothetical protein lerEdw1_001086 [Lerista edwardsae]|nr:hypothetical protein lerEdw1_001086 [Lerista edwardsae]
MEDFKLQSVLLTGSDRGIGLGLVQRFLELPHPPEFIFATCRYPDGLEGQALKELAGRPSSRSKLVLLQLDVTNLQSIREAAEKVEALVARRGLNLLINNAGIAWKTTLASEDAQSMAATYTTNTIGPMQVCQVFLPLLQMAAQQSNLDGMSCSKAAIVNISSNYGSVSHIDGWKWREDIGYRCSKAALNMLTRCQALGYDACRILCVAINPGGVKTHLDAEKEVLTIDTSTRGIVKVLSSLSAKDNGTFLDWRGQTVPW